MYNCLVPSSKKTLYIRGASQSEKIEHYREVRHGRRTTTPLDPPPRSRFCKTTITTHHVIAEITLLPPVLIFSLYLPPFSTHGSASFESTLENSTRDMSHMHSNCQERKRHKNINKFFRLLPGWGGGLPTGWPEVSRPVARGQEFMCCVRNPRNMNSFVRVPGREDR